jgi:5-methylcytosine-specific restriction endonuclease McrA
MPSINRKHLTTSNKVKPLQVVKREKFAEDLYRSSRWYKYSKDKRGTNPVCAMCKGVFPMFALVVDHIIPVRFGGSFLDIRNHQVLCSNCHNHKTATEKTKTVTPSQLNEHNELIPL